MDRSKEAGEIITHALFTTITNANFDNIALIDCATALQQYKDQLRASLAGKLPEQLPDAAVYSSYEQEQFVEKAKTDGILATANENVRPLRETVIFGSKGISAYAHHAAMLGFENNEVYAKLIDNLASVTEDLSLEEMVARVLKTGENALAMALFDQANTTTFGHPEITEVNIGVGTNPGILVSGHDLKDLEELLIQTEGQGADIYTHSEKLPGHYYPALKKYPHLKGAYGSSWWHQNKDFETFNGAILMTTYCVIPIRNNNNYADRFFTTGATGYPGAVHIAGRKAGGAKDFSTVIDKAKSCKPPEEIESGKIIGGFAHNQVLALADKVIEAVKSGAFKRFVVMGGCDGRMKSRAYFSEVAEKLPKDTVILTAGCAKYLYNKLSLGDIGGIPRVLDAGQCNDSYSLAVIAMKLQDAFGFEHINDLPLTFDIGWYEQKAAAVLLDVLVREFDIKVTGEPEEDIAAMMAGN